MKVIQVIKVTRTDLYFLYDNGEVRSIENGQSNIVIDPDPSIAERVERGRQRALVAHGLVNVNKDKI